MSILPALKSAALRLVGRQPSVFFGAAGQFEQEICDIANEVAADVAHYHDWQGLVRFATITGDGVAGEFDLPADYDRMLLTSRVHDVAGWAWGYRQYDDLNAYLAQEGRSFSPHPGGWVILGGKLRFSPTPAAGRQARFAYLSRDYAVDASTASKPAFDADSDSFLLPDRLLTLGIVWRWRENKKLDAAGDQEAFIKALDEYATKDGGARVFERRARRAFPGTHLAWPYELGPATY